MFIFVRDFGFNDRSKTLQNRKKIPIQLRILVTLKLGMSGWITRGSPGDSLLQRDGGTKCQGTGTIGSLYRGFVISVENLVITKL